MRVYCMYTPVVLVKKDHIVPFNAV
jgi:hypothetical protein